MYRGESSDQEPLIPPPLLGAGGSASAQRLLRPLDLSMYLKKYIVGQDEAIKAVSTAVVTHFNVQRALREGLVSPEKVKKRNILLLGPTGCGKTKLGRLAAAYMEASFYLADATNLSEAGYVGRSPEEMIIALYWAAGNDIKATERGIIYIDEIDKKRKTPGYSGKDVSGEGVQNALLRLVEGTKVSWEGTNKEVVTIDTTPILFIAGGAFEGLPELMASRRKERTGIGFGNQTYSRQDLTDSLPTLDDLVAYGMVKQLPPRFSVTARLGQLTEDHLIQILRDVPDSDAKAMKTEFRSYGIELEFSDDAYKLFAAMAIREGSGARSLGAVMYSVLHDFLHVLPSTQKKELFVNKNLVEDPQGTLAKILKEYPIIEQEEEGPITQKGFAVRGQASSG